VITGYNTDVKHRNRVFHIQTEDKGEANPYVESLVYVGGEIVASKRTSYAEVIKRGRDDHAVQDLMEQQHRTMIAAIQRGRFDGPDGSIQIPEGMSASASAEPSTEESAPPFESPVLPPPKPDKKEKREKGERGEKGDPTIASGTKVPVPALSRSLDQLVLDYLASGDVPEEVDLVLSPRPDFLAGRSVQTKLKATSGSPARPLTGASVSVRILSTSSHSSTVFQGKTGSDGSCVVSFMVPAFANGSAAAVIRVTGAGASSEVQYPIRRK
jgi:hypothetical protein